MQTSLFGEGKLTSLAEAFPASPTQMQEKEKVRMMSATNGRKCLEQFGRFGQHGSWAKTFAGLLIGMEGWYSTKSRLTWKLKGTKSSRLYFQLAVSTPPTDEIGYGLLPTPIVMDTVRDLSKLEKRREGLKKRNNGKNGTKRSGNGTGTTLNELMLKGLLPTPQASDTPGKNTGKRQQKSLPKMIRDAGGKTFQLNPLFVGEMMGFPENYTELPFQNGATNQ